MAIKICLKTIARSITKTQRSKILSLIPRPKKSKLVYLKNIKPYLKNHGAIIFLSSRDTDEKWVMHSKSDTATTTTTKTAKTTVTTTKTTSVLMPLFWLAGVDNFCFSLVSPFLSIVRNFSSQAILFQILFYTLFPQPPWSNFFPFPSFFKIHELTIWDLKSRRMT